MLKSRLKLFTISVVLLIISFIVLFIVILNVKERANIAPIELNSSNEASYTPLTTFEKYFNIVHQLDAQNNPIISYENNNVLFDLNSNKISINDSIFDDPYIVDEGQIYIPNSFIEEHFDTYVHKTKYGNKLTAFSTIPIIMYHTMNDSENSTMNTKPENFEEQMSTLKNEGYTGISPFELYDFYFEDGILPEKPVFITFDDGYEDVYSAAYPILKKYNMQATLFVIASRVEENNETNRYPNEVPKISWVDAHEMKDYVTIQNHTWDSHRKIETEKGKSIGQIAAPQAKADGTFETKDEYITRITEDIKNGQEVIKENMGYDSIVFSYPYGEYSDEVIQVLNEYNTFIAVSVSSGKPLHYDHLMKINRIAVHGDWSGEKLIENMLKM